MKELEEQILLRKYRTGKCTPEELALLNAWYSNWNTHDRKPLSEDDLQIAEAKMRKLIGNHFG
jgi:transmembrane sensor